MSGAMQTLKMVPFFKGSKQTPKSKADFYIMFFLVDPDRISGYQDSGRKIHRRIPKKLKSQARMALKNLPGSFSFPDDTSTKDRPEWETDLSAR